MLDVVFLLSNEKTWTKIQKVHQNANYSCFFSERPSDTANIYGGLTTF